MCNQTVGLVQREAERRGVATVGITLSREISERVRPPRTLYLRYPFGHPLGQPHQRAQQRQIVRDALALLHGVTTPGTIVDSPYRWRRTRFE